LRRAWAETGWGSLLSADLGKMVVSSQPFA
jgi:hypothetical protein